MQKVFLGGTCNNSTWRGELIPLLEIDYFNPVVTDWDSAAQERELRERETCDYVLYCITPKMTGVYSIAEVVDDSNKRPEKTLFLFLEKDEDVEFDKGQLKSLAAVGDLVKRNGGSVFSSLSDIAMYLNRVV